MDTLYLKKLKDNLKRRGYDVEIFNSSEELINKIDLLLEDKTAGYGSSMTLKELGIIDMINQRAKKVYRHQPGGHGEEEKAALTADLFFTSANAVSSRGEIVNIDGTGNRVSATCFGPGRVIYVIGTNKVTDSFESAMERAKDTAVKLAKHFGRKTPCVKTGKCENCLSTECVCAVTTIHRKKPYGTDISVFLINGDYGL